MGHAKKAAREVRKSLTDQFEVELDSFLKRNGGRQPALANAGQGRGSSSSGMEALGSLMAPFGASPQSNGRRPLALENAAGQPESRRSSRAWERMSRDELMNQLNHRPSFHAVLERFPAESRQSFLSSINKRQAAAILMRIDESGPIN